MKLSIRMKVFLLLSAFVAVLVIAGVACNALLLERFYVSQNRALLRSVANEAERVLRTAGEDLDSALIQIDRDNGIGIRIVNEKYKVLASSFAAVKGASMGKLPKNIQEALTPETDGTLRETITVVVNENGNPNIVYARSVSGGRYLVLTKSMKGIYESTAIANRFTLFVGLGLLALGGGATLLFSRMITKPVVEMSRVTARMAELDFSERVDVETDDELGKLGAGINEISEKLSRSIERMRRDIARRKRLVRDLSHELKTPIAVIKGYAEGLQNGVAENPEQAARYCAVIASECDRMDAQIQQLLELSKLESEQVQPNSRLFPVSGLFDSLAERFLHEAAQKQIDLLFQAPEGLAIRADEALLGRALENFLTNAIRYTPAQGEIRVSAEQTGHATKLCVFNSGSSIPPEQLERIWDVFYTGEGANGRDSGGHGVGLAIVKSIAELHGGSVAVQNRDDGVEFCLQLPD